MNNYVRLFDNREIGLHLIEKRADKKEGEEQTAG